MYCIIAFVASIFGFFGIASIAAGLLLLAACVLAGIYAVMLQLSREPETAVVYVVKPTKDGGVGVQRRVVPLKETREPLLGDKPDKVATPPKADDGGVAS